jgi:VanZ family protein
MRAGRTAALQAILLLALPALPLLVSLPSQPLYFRVLNDLAHAPVFGALAVVAFGLSRRYATWPAWARYAGALGFTVLAGAIVEWIQPWIGRGGSLADLWTDAAGATAGLAIAALHAGARRLPAMLLLAAATVAVLYPVIPPARAYAERIRQFPTLIDFSAPADWYFIRLQGVTGDARELPARWRRETDGRSLCVLSTGGSFPGIAHIEPQPDWRGHAALMLDVTNPGTRPLTLTLRVHDRSHDNRIGDRFNQSITLAPGSREEITVPLQTIENAPANRRLDLARVAGIILFSDRLPGVAGHEFCLTRVWLQ